MANSSPLWRDEPRNAAQVAAAARGARPRSRSRRLSGALVTSACSARDGPGAELDGLGSGRQQHTDGFTFAATARLADADPGESLACGPHRVDVVALGPGPTRGPLRAVDLDHPFALRQQRRRQARPERAGALDRPQPGIAVASPERESRR